MKIVMAARSLIATGLPFAPREGAFADADVALDEILSLPTPADPLLLRVDATGGTSAERDKVQGDWFFDDRGGPPRRIPRADWSFLEDSARWTRRRRWIDAWEECPFTDWMLPEVARVGVDLKSVVLVVCELCLAVFRAARRSWDLSDVSGQMIEQVRRWARSEVGIEEVRSARLLGVDSSAGDVIVADVVCMSAAAAADHRRDACANYVFAAARSIERTNETLNEIRRLNLTGRVREQIPPVLVLRAVLAREKV